MGCLKIFFNVDTYEKCMRCMRGKTLSYLLFFFFLKKAQDAEKVNE